MFSFNEIATVTLTLFAIIDMLGTVPLIISMRQKVGHIQSEKATLAAGFLMILFLFVGEDLLRLIGIDLSSFAIAGSIVIFILGLEMILGINIFRPDPNDEAGSIIPIAFPIIVGSGTLTTIISLKAVYQVPNILIGILCNLVIVYVVLKSSGWIERKLGKAGLAVMRKFFGIILLSIAVKLFKSNI
ncbi:MAG: MarC family protein [Bacteroidia bacterium]|nr:MarC family protein [Bacteroidia bacterium]